MVCPRGQDPNRGLALAWVLVQAAEWAVAWDVEWVVEAAVVAEDGSPASTESTDDV